MRLTLYRGKDPKYKLASCKSVMMFIVVFSVIMLISQNTYIYAANTSSDMDEQDNTSGVDAVLINDKAVFKMEPSDNVGLKSISDNQRSTRYKFKNSTAINIEATEAFKSVYVIFNKPPKHWQISSDDLLKQQGTYGFMHELVELPDAVKNVTLTIQPDTEICDIYLYSDGALPSDVEVWEPPLYDADMLLIPTHADDEHLFFGGIMPYYAGQLGKKVQVAYLTNHYGEWYRPHELLEGLWKVGIKAYPIIPEFNDYYSDNLEHARTLYNTDSMLEYQVMLLRRFTPEVVIGHDINGEYGHGVHRLNADLLMQAVELSGNPDNMPQSAEEYGVFDVPKTYLHLYDKNQLTMDIDIPLSNFNNKTAYEMAQEGFLKHQSQTKYFSVEKKGKYDCRKFGLFRSTVGDDVLHNDFFENIIYPTEEKDTTSDLIGGLTSPPPKPSNSENEPEIKNDNDSQDKTPDEIKKSVFQTLTPYIFIIAGFLIIIFVLVRHNKKQKTDILETTNALSKIRKDTM